MDSIDLRVRYQLGEYKQLVVEFKPRSSTNKAAADRFNSSPFWTHPVVVRVALILIVTPVFFYKTWRVGECRFVVDRQGITRSGDGHVAKYSWDEVTHVHRLSCAYLIELEEGAMPLPYRVFTEEQRAAFEALVPTERLWTPARGSA